MILGLIRIAFVFFQWHRSLIFLEYNAKIFVARRAPWQKATLTSLVFVRSAKTNFRWNFPFQQIFELIHSALCTWAAAWKFSLSANKREIVPKHYSLPLPDPATSESLVGEVTQYANWLKGKGAWSQWLSKSRSGWLLKETRSCFQMNYNGPSCFHNVPQPL